jgi:hypothetical protein
LLPTDSVILDHSVFGVLCQKSGENGSGKVGSVDVRTVVFRRVCQNRRLFPKCQIASVSLSLDRKKEELARDLSAHKELEPEISWSQGQMHLRGSLVKMLAIPRQMSLAVVGLDGIEQAGAFRRRGYVGIDKSGIFRRIFRRVRTFQPNPADVDAQLSLGWAQHTHAHIAEIFWPPSAGKAPLFALFLTETGRTTDTTNIERQLFSLLA